jgi:hypothetical protein
MNDLFCGRGFYAFLFEMGMVQCHPHPRNLWKQVIRRESQEAHQNQI